MPKTHQDNQPRQNKKRNFNPLKEYGGSLLREKRKTKRPIEKNKPLHLVMKFAFCCWNEAEKIETILRAKAKKYSLQIKGIGFERNHVHLVMIGADSNLFQCWFAAVAGTLSQGGKRKVFQERIYSRVMNWGNDYLNVLRYLCRNCLEARGMAYTGRGKKMEKFERDAVEFAFKIGLHLQFSRKKINRAFQKYQENFSLYFL